jgi:hypothetical protein
MAAQELYEKGYCARCDCPENRIKEQQLGQYVQDLGKAATSLKLVELEVPKEAV